MFMGNRKFSQGPSPRQRTTGNCWLLREGESASPWMSTVIWLSSAELSALTPYTQEQRKQTQNSLFIYVCAYVHIYTYMHVTCNQSKRDYQLGVTSLLHRNCNFATAVSCNVNNSFAEDLIYHPKGVETNRLRAADLS